MAGDRGRIRKRNSRVCISTEGEGWTDRLCSGIWEILKLDLMYIQNYNIRLDFEIMFKTVQILFIRESTEGMEAGQFIALTKEQEGIYEREK